MSRAIRLEVTVGDEDIPCASPDNMLNVLTAAWDSFTGLYASDVAASAVGDGALYGGRCIEDLVSQIAEAAWKEQGSYVPVEAHCTDLENLPYETLTRDEKSYNAMVAALIEKEKSNE